MTSSPNGTVLVVEPSKFAELVAIGLEHRGLIARIARSGREALDAIQAEVPAVALVELHLSPEVPGAHVLRVLQSKGVPTIGMSRDYTGPRVTTMCTSDYGAAAFYEKPFQMDLVLDRLAALCPVRPPTAFESGQPRVAASLANAETRGSGERVPEASTGIGNQETQVRAAVRLASEETAVRAAAAIRPVFPLRDLEERPPVDVDTAGGGDPASAAEASLPEDIATEALAQDFAVRVTAYLVGGLIAVLGLALYLGSSSQPWTVSTRPPPTHRVVTRASFPTEPLDESGQPNLPENETE